MAPPRIVVRRTLSDEVEAEVRRFVGDAFGGEFGDEDWAHALGGWHVLAMDDDGAVQAHAAVVSRVIEVAGRPLHTGYVEAVATVPAVQGTGLGSAVMGELGSIIRHEFELGALSTGRHSFYARLGWERWAGPTFVREDGALVRTAEEDDGIMVMRFGASEHLDLTAPISCEAREGDDW